MQNLIEKVILFTLGNVFIFHVMFPLLWLILQTEEQAALEAAENNP